MRNQDGAGERGIGGPDGDQRGQGFRGDLADSEGRD